MATVTNERIKAKVNRWIWDTGAGIDIVPAKDVANMSHLITKTATPLPITTANGESSVDKEIWLKLTAFKQIVKPFVLDGSPAVLSVGWRCMELGYDFWWPAFKRPIITLPSGVTVKLDVEDYVPYLDSTAYSCGLKSKETIFRQFAMSVIEKRRNGASSSSTGASADASLGSTGAGVPVLVGNPGNVEVVPPNAAPEPAPPPVPEDLEVELAPGGGGPVRSERSEGPPQNLQPGAFPLCPFPNIFPKTTI